MLGGGDSFGINGSFGAPERNLILTLIKKKQNFTWVYITMVITVICLLKKVYKFKANNKNVHFPNQPCLGNISNKFGNVEAEEVSLKWNVYDFSIDYDAINKSGILNIHKYLMVKNNIK